ncbi:hypothetical protein GCM10022246_24660 [Pedobacter ginsengiterrae]|uniref:Uncharacterized protein n=1 Tax=Pedobacter ginsengiterrae TaxID=871696 RepID=A0ABP7PTY3_9SPHI
MEEKQLTPAAAFDIIYRATGALQLNRADSQLLEAALRTIASIIPQEKNPQSEQNAEQ